MSLPVVCSYFVCGVYVVARVSTYMVVCVYLVWFVVCIVRRVGLCVGGVVWGLLWLAFPFPRGWGCSLSVCGWGISLMRLWLLCCSIESGCCGGVV